MEELKIEVAMFLEGGRTGTRSEAAKKGSQVVSCVRVFFEMKNCLWAGT